MNVRNTKEIPDSPGIYLFRNKQGELIYVGKAVSLKKRVASYFQKSRKHDTKTASLIRHIDTVDFIQLRSDIEALLIEYRFIKEFKPKFNILLKDDKQYPLLKFTDDLYPCIKVVRNKLPDNATYLGPFTESYLLRKTKREIEKIFKIRPCSFTSLTEKQAKHCLYKHTGQCSCPCLSKITHDDYQQNIKDALLLLSGHSKELLKWLEKRMDKLSRGLQFEEAAQLRDTIESLKQLSGSRIKQFQKFNRPNSSYKQELLEIKELLSLKSVPQVIEAFDISNIYGLLATGSLVHFVNGKPDKRFYKHFRIKNTLKIDDYAMMREVIQRHFSSLITHKKRFPDLIIIDGGKGHLETARLALNKLNVSQTPIISIAKKQEEIFIPNNHHPIRLKKSSPALQLFQRLRDEAHRFALSYHRKLRHKKIHDSILYKIPGLGKNKAEELLKQFSSVKNIRKASLNDISIIPGFGKKTAQIILDFLNK
ncbi:helix-hairpin-helix domain-containing protein, partial [Chlamydiota bacterium]